MYGAIHIWDHIRTDGEVLHEFQNGISACLLQYAQNIKQCHRSNCHWTNSYTIGTTFNDAFGPECFKYANDSKWLFGIQIGSSIFHTSTPLSHSTAYSPASMMARLEESVLRSVPGFTESETPLTFSVGFIWNENGGFFMTEPITLKYVTRLRIVSVTPWIIAAGQPTLVNTGFIYVVSSVSANTHALEWSSNELISIIHSSEHGGFTPLVIPTAYENASFTLDFSLNNQSHSFPCTVNPSSAHISCEKPSLLPSSENPVLLSTAVYFKQDLLTVATLSQPFLFYSTANASAPLFGIGEQVAVTFSQPILVSEQGQFNYRAWDSVSGLSYGCIYQSSTVLVCTLTRTNHPLDYQEYNLTLQMSALQLNQSLWLTISSQPVTHYSLGTIPSLTTATITYSTDARSVVTLNATLPAAVRILIHCSMNGIIVVATPMTGSNDYECGSIVSQPELRSLVLTFIEPDTNSELTISRNIQLAFVDTAGSINSTANVTTFFIPNEYVALTVTGIRMAAFTEESFICKYGPNGSPTRHNSTAIRVENLTPGETSAGASAIRVTCNIISSHSAVLFVTVWMRPFAMNPDSEVQITLDSQELIVLARTTLSWTPSQVRAAYTTASPILATIELQNNSLDQDIVALDRIYCRHLAARTQTTSDVLIQWEPTSATIIKCNIESQITTKVTTSLWYIHDGVELLLSTSDFQFAFIRLGTAANQTGNTAHPYPNAAITTNQSVIPVMFNVGFDASMAIAESPAVADVYVCRYYLDGNSTTTEISVTSLTSDGSRTNLTCEFPGDGLQPGQSHAINVRLWIKVNGVERQIVGWVFRFYYLQQAIPTWSDSSIHTATVLPSATVNLTVAFSMSTGLLQQALCAQNPFGAPKERQLVNTPGLRKYSCTLLQPSLIGRIEISLWFPVINAPETDYIEITATRLVFTFLPSITLQTLSPSVGFTTTNLNTQLNTTMPTTTNFPEDIAFHCRWKRISIGNNTEEGSSSALWNTQNGTFTCTISAADSQRVALSLTATVDGTTLVLSENTLNATLVRPMAAVYAASNAAAVTLNSTFDVKIHVPFTTDPDMIARTTCKQSGVVVPLQRPTTGDGVYICSLSRAITSSLNNDYVHPITLWYTDDYGESLEITGSH